MNTFKDFFAEDKRPLAPVEYIGHQEGLTPEEGFDLFDMLQKVGEWGIGFTISRKTLESLGFYVPPIPPGTPRGTPVSQLDDRMVKSEAQSKSNPFGYHKPRSITPRKQLIPRKTYKQDMEEKPHKKDTIKPRDYHIDTFGKLKRLFK